MRSLPVVSLALLLTFAGCMKVHEEMVIMPDGTGKLILHVSVKAPKDEPDKSVEDEIMAGDPDDMEKHMPGIVAFTRPRVERGDGLRRIQMAFYFEDVNKVKYTKDVKEGFSQEFSFRREGEGFVLEVKGNIMEDTRGEKADDIDTPASLKKQNEEMLSKLFEGFEFRHSVRLPGRITRVEGFQNGQERTALYRIDDKDFQTAEGRKNVNKVTHFRAACGKSEVTEAEAADFRKELDLAKAEWTELRKEMKKKAEKKK